MDDRHPNHSAPFGWMGLPADEEADLYRLLAYLQRVDLRYRERKLYPHLDELRLRLEQLSDLRRKREELEAGMPRPIIGIDPSTMALVRAAASEDGVLRVLDAMLAYTVPELDRAFERGNELRERLAAAIRFEPVGVLPLYTREGYLLIQQGREARAYAYELAIPVPGHDAAKHRELRTRYIAAWTMGISCTFEHVKAELVRNGPGSPNPAVFAFVSDISLPAIETFVPLAKQLVYEVVADGGKRP